MRFFKCYDISEYVEYLTEKPMVWRGRYYRKERIKTPEHIKEPLKNDLGLKAYNYSPKNMQGLKRTLGRPVGTHSTVIGNNAIGRRWDFARHTRNAA